MIRTYSELTKLPSLSERYEYLRLGGRVGETTFGFDRYLNQAFYKSGIWKAARRKVIVRDNGCEMGLSDFPIGGIVYVHHMNPVSISDLESLDYDYLTNPEFLVSVSYNTHQAIHYGNIHLLPETVIERTPFDTCPWRL